MIHVSLLLLTVSAFAQGHLSRQGLVPAVERGYPTRTTTDMPGYNGTAACIADRGRLQYFGTPKGFFIRHCNCWMPGYQPTAPHFREDYLEVRLYSPKRVKELAVQGCTSFEKMWVSLFKVAYTVDGQNWRWVGRNNHWTEFKGMHHAAAVVRQTLDIPLAASKVRFFPLRCESEAGTVPTCAFRVEVFFAEIATPFQDLMAQPKLYQAETNGLPAFVP